MEDQSNKVENEDLGYSTDWYMECYGLGLIRRLQSNAEPLHIPVDPERIEKERKTK